MLPLFTQQQYAKKVYFCFNREDSDIGRTGEKELSYIEYGHQFAFDFVKSEIITIMLQRIILII